MQRMDLESLSIDQLWALRQEIVKRLVAKLIGEIGAIENRLRRLDRPVQSKQSQSKTGRRPYPRVAPKFRNPNEPSQTWTGRGRQPRWLMACLNSGRRIDDFRIDQAAA